MVLLPTTKRNSIRKHFFALLFLFMLAKSFSYVNDTDFVRKRYLIKHMVVRGSLSSSWLKVFVNMHVPSLIFFSSYLKRVKNRV